LDLTRILVAAEIGLDHLRDFFGQCVASLKARPQDDPRLDDLPAQDVSLTDDSGLSHRGMSQQSTFDLEWPDAVAGTLDHVADATFEPEISVLVATGEVAGHYPAVALQIARCLRIIPIAQPVALVRIARETDLPIRQLTA